MNDSSRKGSGRSQRFTDDELRRAAQFAYRRRVRSRRGAEDLVYRRFAMAAIEHFCEAYPGQGAPLEWFLIPAPRYSLLSELGRIAELKSGEEDALEWSAPGVNRLIEVALQIAAVEPSTKMGVAMIRESRRRHRDGEAGPGSPRAA